MKTHAIRLNPDQDLKTEIIWFCQQQQIQAGCIVSSVGSLKKLKLRLASSNAFLEKTENFEIITLNGTVSVNGCHLHLGVSDARGQMFGGHLVDGNLVYTTCELVILEVENRIFRREVDQYTGYKELIIK